jgi:lantibiotic modifying enzyme
MDRPPRLINPSVPAALTRVIARCLAPDPSARFPSMAAVDAALAAIERRPAARTPRSGTAVGRGTTAEAPAAARGERTARREAARLARRLGDSLSAAALPAPNGKGLAWASAHPLAGGIHSRDLNTGNAGALLALAEIADTFGDPEHRRTLAEGARWLRRAPPMEGPALPGLYVGEAGIGAALLRAGQVLGDAALVAAAVEKGRLVASLPHASPDLFNGTAGRLRFHLLLLDATGDREHLAAARACGAHLLDAAEAAGRDELRWTIPPGYDALSGHAYLGYAHGAAGIADALLDLAEATGDDRFFAAARGAGRWLVRLARPALDGGEGLDWPDVEGGQPIGPFWCHGAAGVGRFLLHAAGLDLLPEAAGYAARAALSAARGSRWSGPTQCHGLAGNIEFLLDMYQATGDAGHLREARALASLLDAFALERDGGLVWPSESPDVVTPDYMVGYAGVALCLLRLAQPGTRPHVLSRNGFGPDRRRAEGLTVAASAAA